MLYIHKKCVFFFEVLNGNLTISVYPLEKTEVLQTPGDFLD